MFTHVKFKRLLYLSVRETWEDKARSRSCSSTTWTWDWLCKGTGFPFLSGYLLRSILGKKMSKLVQPCHTLVSKLDSSANFVSRLGAGLLESRYVRRSVSKVTAYLSSHTDCALGCKMCHLTQQRIQLVNAPNPVAVRIASYRDQLRTVLKYHTGGLCRLNVAFMAKGDALANPSVVRHFPSLHQSLEEEAKLHGSFTQTRLCISSIFPKTMAPLALEDVLCAPHHFYYSMYSADAAWRRNWLPAALPAPTALEKLRQYQNVTNKTFTIHFCLIKGENDTNIQIQNMENLLRPYRFRARISLVRFNPPKGSQQCDASDDHYKHVLGRLGSVVKADPLFPHKVVHRVGHDVYASCGMFVPRPVWHSFA